MGPDSGIHVYARRSKYYFSSLYVYIRVCSIVFTSSTVCSFNSPCICVLFGLGFFRSFRRFIVALCMMLMYDSFDFFPLLLHCVLLVFVFKFRFTWSPSHLLRSYLTSKVYYFFCRSLTSYSAFIPLPKISFVTFTLWSSSSLKSTSLFVVVVAVCFFFLLLFCSFEKIKRREAEEKNHWSLLLCVRAGSLPLSRWETRNEFESCPMLDHRQCIPEEVWMPENLTLAVDVVVGTDNGICRI